jgi:hypothetical protein
MLGRIAQGLFGLTLCDIKGHCCVYCGVKRPRHLREPRAIFAGLMLDPAEFYERLAVIPQPPIPPSILRIGY